MVAPARSTCCTGADSRRPAADCRPCRSVSGHRRVRGSDPRGKCGQRAWSICRFSRSLRVFRAISRWLGKGLAGSLPSPVGRGIGRLSPLSRREMDWPGSLPSPAGRWIGPALSPLPPGDGLARLPPGEGLARLSPLSIGPALSPLPPGDGLARLSPLSRRERDWPGPGDGLARLSPSPAGRGAGGEGLMSRNFATGRPIPTLPSPFPHPKPLSRRERGFLSLQREMALEGVRLLFDSVKHCDTLSVPAQPILNWVGLLKGPFGDLYFFWRMYAMDCVAVFVDAGNLFAQGSRELCGRKLPRIEMTLDHVAMIAKLKASRRLTQICPCSESTGMTGLPRGLHLSTTRWLDGRMSRSG